MESMTFINDYGTRITFSRDGPFYLKNIDTSSTGLSLSTESILGVDGDKFIKAKYNPKTIIAEVSLIGIDNGRYSKKEMYQLWQKVGNALVCKELGTLIYRNDARSSKIACRPIEIPDYERVVATRCDFKIEFYAPSPYWLSEFEFIKRIGQVEGGKRYPLKWPKRYGEWVKNLTLLNDINIDIPVIIEISQDANYILITNETTGEYTKVNEPLTANQKMLIDTDACTIIVIDYDNLGNEISRAYADHKTDINGGYIKLVPGYNEITIDNGRPDTATPALIRYHTRSLVG